MRPPALVTGFLVLGFLAGTTSLASDVAAQNSVEELNTGSSCIRQVNDEMAREHRHLRNTLVGQLAPEDAPVGSVRFDKEDGSAWYKIANNSWRSAALGYQQTTRSDFFVGQRNEFPPRRGILEDRSVPISHVIPQIGQSLEVFQCHLAALCESVQASIRGDDGYIPISIPGCIDQYLPVLKDCKLTEDKQETTEEADVLSYCEGVAEEMLNDEVAYLGFIIEVEGANRSLSQLAGALDRFGAEWEIPLEQTLRHAVDLATELQRIPCFLSSCTAQ